MTVRKTAAKTLNKFKPSKAEEDYVILRLHKKEFHGATGEPMHKPYIFKTDPQSYYQFLQFPQGNSIEEVIYLPEGVKTPEQWKKSQDTKAKRK